MEVLYPRCAGLDIHKDTVVACVRCVTKPQRREVRTFGTTTGELLALADWLEGNGCTHVAMEATGVYWKPVWHILEGRFELVLANAQHIRNVPGRKTDVSDAAWIADLLAHGLIRNSFVPVDYDWERLAREMKEEGLPDEFAETIHRRIVHRLGHRLGTTFHLLEEIGLKA